MAPDEHPSPAEDFASQVLEVVAAIPPGMVMTYGDVAAAIGSNAPRAVGKVMAHGGSSVPWWRVIRADGSPPKCHDERAIEHYREEHTPLVASAARGYRIDLGAGRYRPTG